MNYTEVINRIGNDLIAYYDAGKVAKYIPELSIVDPSKFGVHVTNLQDENFGFGDYNEAFSAQSIAKVLALTLAYNLVGEDLWKRVGVEPSGSKFNSLIQLELEEGIPRNPLINAGALVVCDVLLSHLEHPKQALDKFIASTTNSPKVSFSDRIAKSEAATGFTNKALANLMKAFGNITNEVEAVLEFYFHLCSLEMSCADLTRTFLYLANNGYSPCSEQQITSESKSNRINAIMQLCGFYDEAGDFAFKVGLPGKSGVGGGIVAVYPEKYSIAVWSPKLNPKGNSAKGMAFLERFTRETGTSIF